MSHSPGIIYLPWALIIWMFRPSPTKPTLAIPVIRPFLITTVTFGSIPPSRVLTTLTLVKISASGAVFGFDSAQRKVDRHNQAMKDALIPQAPKEDSQERLSVGCRGVKQIQERQL